MGSHWAPEQTLRGYYIDFSVKTETPSWPPEWLHGGNGEIHVAAVQWGLGALERYVKGEGEVWLSAAIDTGEYLIEMQIGAAPGTAPGCIGCRCLIPTGSTRPGPRRSLRVRQRACSCVFTTRPRTSALPTLGRALHPMRVPVAAGGALTEVDGLPFFEEYPTRPPSLVLNGAIFALWGFHDVAEALGDRETRQWYEAGIEGLSSLLDRYDTGYWSRYDLYPHPAANVASSAYHLLHINQLSVLGRLTARPEFDSIRERFERYRESRACRARALRKKVAFRIVTPRNAALAHRLPWKVSASAIKATTRI